MAILVAVATLAVGADGLANRQKPAAQRRAKKKHRAHAPSRARSPVPPEPERDELVLSPTLLMQMQRNLRDGGYYDGRADGRLTPRTRRALADFQRDYHIAGAGALNVPTASGLLGLEVVHAFTLPSPGSPHGTQ